MCPLRVIAADCAVRYSHYILGLDCGRLSAMPLYGGWLRHGSEQWPNLLSISHQNKNSKDYQPYSQLIIHRNDFRGDVDSSILRIPILSMSQDLRSSKWNSQVEGKKASIPYSKVLR